jgi:hypothetical protein
MKEKLEKYRKENEALMQMVSSQQYQSFKQLSVQSLDRLRYYQKTESKVKKRSSFSFRKITGARKYAF